MLVLLLVIIRRMNNPTRRMTPRLMKEVMMVKEWINQMLIITIIKTKKKLIIQ